MTLFYFAATQETVLPIVTLGRLSKESHSNYLSCFRNSADCLKSTKETFNNVFIIMFDVPNGYQSDSFNYIYDEDEAKECLLITNHIDPNWIKKVVVNSSFAKTTLKNLFRDVTLVAIEVNSNLFNDNIVLSQELNYLEEYESSGDESTFSQDITKMDLDDKPNLSQNSQPRVVFFRLTANREHIDMLISEIKSARKKVLITSYDINEYVFDKYNLYGIFAEAVRRGVKFYLYYNDANSLSKNLQFFFDAHDIKYDQSFTHSKLLVIDNMTIAIGSYNWLSRPYRDSLNGSIFYLGHYGPDLSEAFWDHLRRYRALQYGQFWGVSQFDWDEDNCIGLEFDLPNSSSMIYLPTLETHQDYLLSLFGRAKDRVIICSPFISLNFLEEINYKTLFQTAFKGVKIYFVSTPKAINETEFYNFLIACHLPHLYLVPVNNFHLKTIILDHDEIAEGSFNWLSASRDRFSDCHNHEATMVVNGPIAVEMISEFFQSRVGKEIATNSIQVEYTDKLFIEQCRLP